MDLREYETHFWSRITKAGIIGRERSDVKAEECETQVGYLTQCKEMTCAGIEENMEQMSSDLFLLERARSNTNRYLRRKCVRKIKVFHETLISPW